MEVTLSAWLDAHTSFSPTAEDSGCLYLCINTFLYSFQVLYCGYYEHFSHNFRLSALGTFPSNIQLWHSQSNSGRKRSKTDRAHSYPNYFTTIPTEHTRAQITFCSLQLQAHNGGAREQQSPLTETKHYHIIEIKFQHLSEVIYFMLVQDYKFSIHVENSVPLL